MLIHNLGFPRIGKQRELKFLIEQYWQGGLTQQALLNECTSLRQQNWQLQQQAGIEYLPVGDFAHYDHVLNTSLYLGVVPKRFNVAKKDIAGNLEIEFSIARGKSSDCCQCAASDMTKWFNTNYHYLVPELDAQTDFSVNIDNLLAQINEAKQLSHNIKPVLVGPLTYLYLSDYNASEQTPSEQKSNQLSLVEKITTAYQQIFDQLKQVDVQWLQIDEPILGLELSEQWQQAFTTVYNTLNKGTLKLLLTTYFASIDHHLELIKNLAVDGLHIDTVAEQTDVNAIIAALPDNWVISLGVVDGRNVWKTDLVSRYQKLQPLYRQLGERLWLAPSCSLLHSPVDLDSEQKLNNEVKSWLAFAKQKCQELALLKQALVTENSDQITLYSAPALARRVSTKINKKDIQQRVADLTEHDFHRAESFATRKTKQQKSLNLPLLPTTTIGSFPQTGSIRQVRAQWRRGQINDVQYQAAIELEIFDVIKRQEAIDLDVLVHGEPERNDMVEYFGELLDGFVFTQFAWVQSYGSRCVKPPIIYGDISRPQAMTVAWTNYAQSLTKKQVKGMLTGPVTILAWSFVRDDLALEVVAKQIALAINDEVTDLIKSGTQIIQIDEPAIREGMPLKQSLWADYLSWATAAFRLSAAQAPSEVQIHSHMCYSEFNEILDAIIALDADVLTIETSRSNMALLKAFEQQSYPNDIGPGVYDIHSPNIPSVEWMVDLIHKAAKTIPIERLWVNPDCGLKTRQWPETQAALENMVKAAKQLRVEFTNKIKQHDFTEA
jgi:5-methyltetrahydropteroyltriglutamate--homocysteine methyltransferase